MCCCSTSSCRWQALYPSCQTHIVQPTGEPTITGDICHIKAKSPLGPRYDKSQTDYERHGLNNLILLCKVHHALVDGQPDKYIAELLTEFKEIHECNGNIELTPQDARLAHILWDSYLHIEASGDAKVMVNSPGGMQAHNITIKTTNKKVTFTPPADSIATCLPMRNYAMHLIERYNEFQKAHTDKVGRGKYAIIHKAIRGEFGCKWDMVPQSRFNDLVALLQRRIDNTMVGRIMRSRGQPRYSTYEQFLSKYHNPGQ